MVGPVNTNISISLSPQRSSAVEMNRSMRQIAQARRLLQLNQIRGSEANRVNLLLTQAEQRLNNGAPLDAIRLSYRALSTVRDLIDPRTTNGFPIQNRNTSNNNNPSTTTSITDNQSARPNQSESSPPLFQRRTTTYADGSDDGGVSFQYQQPVSNLQAPFAVRQHELSHIFRETTEAILNGQRVLTALTVRSQIDQLSGERVIRGGQARIAIFPDIELIPPNNLGNHIDLTG